ncbi:hypothetical protein CkaCkLH20_05587 [Colletotrichum karsti]|uniref:Uncharacterized protein n=1 Tax=Colletotrichum karsti TaxID=1095194 RepID=A0A9P6IA24_9PEZI|nr:uncharacterized protein CkaCkLH20_05587 [Colletotrichum karsti]KAF9876741.1 hypothetical protein CkaCkLH20_05587 [Colletotrichum karsti]
MTIPPTYNSFGPRTCLCRPSPGPAPPPTDSDPALLSIFQGPLTQVYPFVVIPPGTSAADLQASRPFLMSCIRMVASFRSPRSMQAQMYQLKAHVAEQMLLRSERSLDLLSGLVVMVGWYHHHCMAHTQLQNLVALAVTQASELGLTRSPGYQERTSLMVQNLGEIRERTNEQKRLLLAVWYLSSTVSGGLQQIESLTFTPYMRRCLRDLETAREYESDAYLACLVKIQILSNKITSHRQSREDDEEDSETVCRAPFSAYTSAFDAELKNLVRDMPTRLQDDHFIRARVNGVRLRLHEPPELDAALLSSLSKSSIASGSPSPLDGFYRANAAIKAWYDDWLVIPISSYNLVTIPVSMTIIHAITTLGRWAKLLLASDMRRRKARQPSEGSLVPPPDPSGDYNNPSPLDSATTTMRSSSYSPASSPADDSELAQAVSALKIQFATQPALGLDVSGILGQLGRSMEEASAFLASQSEDPPDAGHNIWSYTATKLKIAQLKLEQWAETVAGEEEDEDEEDEEEGEDPNGDEELNHQTMQGILSGGAIDKNVGSFVGPARDFGVYEDNWVGGGDMTGVFDNLGPFSWPDGVGDWGAAIMGSMHQNG